MIKQIEEKQHFLVQHPLFNKMTSLSNIRTFMEFHIFAVWDFMSLLKSLQKKTSCVEVPWTPSVVDPRLTQLVNEIVLGEESDVDQKGKACSHFSLYLTAMDEVQAQTNLIRNFIHQLNFNLLPKELKSIVAFHIDVAMNAELHQVAAAFFYGREKLIPSMFQSIVETLEENKMKCPTLLYYFKRHIEVDLVDHGPKALECLEILMDTEEKKNEVYEMALRSLEYRNRLWNFIDSQLPG